MTCLECGAPIVQRSAAPSHVKFYCNRKCVGAAKRRLAGPPKSSKGRPLSYVHGHPRATPAGLVFEHILIAERALGRFIGAEHPIHHHDQNKANNANTNLVICENNAYHMLLHRRSRIFNAGGDPDADKICSKCKLALSVSLFHRSRTSYDGRERICKACYRPIGTAKARVRRIKLVALERIKRIEKGATE